MPRPVELTLGLLMLGGSIVGLVGFLPTMLLGNAFRFPGEILILATLALFSVGIWCGVQAIRGNRRWISVARFFWLAQVPAFTTSTFSLLISCGLGAWLAVRASGSQVGVNAWVQFGSAVHWSFLQYSPFIGFGINVVAFFIAGYLFAVQSKISYLESPPGEA